MNPIQKYLYHLKILRFTKGKLLQWSDQKDLSKLLFALEKGDFEIRKEALPLIYNLNPGNLESILLQYIYDPVRPVCFNSLDLLSKFDTKGKHKVKIEEIKLNWQVKLAKQRENFSAGNTEFDPMWKKADSNTVKRTKDFESMQSNMRPPM